MPISAHRALRTTARGLIAAFFLLAFSRADAQVLVKVNDSINFKLGLLMQPQADFQEVPNGTNTGTGGYQENLLVRRMRFIVGGQVAKNVFFFAETENSNLGKTAVGGTGTGAKSLGSGFSLLDAVGEWRIAKAFNIQFGEILVPVNRWIITSSTSTFNLDQSAYNLPSNTQVQGNAGRDTGVMFRGYFFCDRLEYRSAILQGFRAPGVKNSPRFTERLQYNFFDTEVYNMPSYTGANYGNRKILALGAAYDTQSDYKVASADMFLDVPIDIGSFESTVAYQYINGGATFSALPQQNTFSFEAGVFMKPLKLAPIVRYEQKAFTQAANESKNESRYVAGLNFYPIRKAENNFNIKVWYQRVTPKVGFATNEFTVQMQVMYF
jgi:hypothetical protein